MIPFIATLDYTTSQLPFYVEFRSAYEQLRERCEEVRVVYTRWDKEVYHTLHGEKLTRFHPKGLPPRTALPDIADLFSTTRKSGPTQRTLSDITEHAAWLSMYCACDAFDMGHEQEALAKNRSITLQTQIDIHYFILGYD